MYKVNLLPPELMGWQKKVDKRRLVMGALCLVLVGIMLLGYGRFLYNADNLRRQLQDVETELTQYQVEVANVQRLTATKEQNEKAVAALQRIIETRRVWGSTLEDINLTMPVDLWLTGLQIVDDKTKLPQKTVTPAQPGDEANQTTPAVTGNPSEQTIIPNPPSVMIIEGKSGTTPSIGVFQKHLTNLIYFSSVQLENMEVNDEDGTFIFTINAVLKESDRNAAASQ